MQRVPGLKPVQLPIVPRRPVRSRAQAPDAENLTPPPLQPAAQPVDTYVRPPEPPEDNGLFNLAESLRSLNPEVERFMVRRSEGSTADALEYLQTNDIESVNELVRTGNTPQVLTTREGRRVYAERRAREDFATIQRRYNEDFARGEGDIQALINDVVGETFSIYGNDDTFKDVYTQVFEPLRSSIVETHQADATELELNARRDDVFAAWHERIDNDLQLGKDPAQIVQSIFNDFPDNHDFLRIHPTEQQEYLLQLASQQVSAGNLDMAQAILQMERKDGPYRGSLLSDRNFAEQSANLMEQIETERIRQANAGVEDASYEAVISEALVAGENGTILSFGSRTIPTANGGTRTISQEEIQRVVADRAVQQIAQAAQYNQWTEAQAEQAEIDYFTTSGLPHPQWIATWNLAAGQASLSNISQGNLPPDLTEAFQQYRLMSAEHMHYLSSHLDQRTRGFYDVANLLMEAGHVSTEDQALQQAAIATMRMSPTDAEARVYFQDVKERAGRIISQSDHWTGWGRQATNANDVRNKLNEYATLYMLAGLGEEAALNAAAKTFQGSHTNVLGAYIPNDSRIPMDQFKPLAERYVTQFLADNPDLDWEFDLEHLSIAQVGNGPGSYQIVDARTRIGLVEFPGYEFSLQSLLSWDAAQQAAAREQAINETVENAAANTAEDAEAAAFEEHTRSLDIGPDIGVIP